MFNFINGSTSGLFNAHKVLSFALALGALSAGATPTAMAGDAEITLKASAPIAADPIFGVIDLGGTALVGVEPDEIDIAIAGSGTALVGVEPDEIDVQVATTGAAPAELVLGTSVVALEGLTLEGLAPEDIAFGRDGLAYLTIEAGSILLEGVEVRGSYGVDAAGMETIVTYPGSLVLEPIAGTLEEGRDPTTGQVSIGLKVEFIVADILHEGGAGYHMTNVTLKRGVIGQAAPLITDLPMHIEAGSGSQEDAGCSPSNICACGGVDSCNTMLAGCFSEGIDGSWDCVKYNDQGQCVLGMCDVN